MFVCTNFIFMTTLRSSWFPLAQSSVRHAQFPENIYNTIYVYAHQKK